MNAITNILMVPISSIRETPENWDIYIRPEDDDQFPALVDSIRKNGVMEPITISSDNFIISGHRRNAAVGAATSSEDHVNLWEVPVIVMDDIKIGPMSPDERIKILIAHNRGSRVKTSNESIAEAMALVDPQAAMRAAEQRKDQLFTKVKTSCELIESEGSSRRTDPESRRGEFLDAVIKILEDLEERKMLPISARHIHYKLLAGGVRTSAGKAGHPYGTKQSDSKLLSKLLTDARSAGHIDDSWLSDDTRPSHVFHHQLSVGDYVAEEVETLFQNYYSNIHRDQSAHVEMIVEKNTIFPLLNRHISRTLRIPITSARGYLSYPAACEIKNRFKESGKSELYIVYISDHDPEGMDMPKSFVKYLREDHSIEAKVIRAAVTDEQIEKYGLLPDAQAKVDSSRYNSYVEAHGTDVWELDSMDPEMLVHEIKQACLSCLDIDTLNSALAREKEDDVKLARLNAAVAKLIPDILHQLESSAA